METTDREARSVVSLYSGAGGLDLGFAEAGFNVLWANDIDADAVKTHNQLFRHQPAIVGDLTSALKEHPPPSNIDLVIGGPPCQGFSTAGHMSVNDPRNEHVRQFLSVVGDLRPAAFVMENVKALAVNRRWSRLRHELQTQAIGLGYTVQLLLLNASHFGVPQARERMFFIGTTTPTPVVPVPTTSLHPPTVRTALESLPQYGERGNSAFCTAKVTPAKNPVLRRSPFAGMLFNGQGRPMNLDKPAPTLPASMGGNRTPIIDQMELETDRPSWVIEYHQHLWNGGKPASEIPERLRRITVDEAAALQTFPAGMHWEGGRSSQYRQIGNAVPPMLAFHVAAAVRTALDGVVTSPLHGFTGNELLSSSL